MVNTKGTDLQNKLQARSEGSTPSIRALLSSDAYKKRFQEMLGKKAAGFLTSVMNAVNMNPNLQAADPYSVVSAAAVAATLDLPVDQNLGFSAIVPYGGKAQFQMMYRGFIQLAMRSGLYKTMHVTEVYEGELQFNPFTGEIDHFDMENQYRAVEDRKKIVGYLSYFKLVNGYEKYFYMSKKQVEAHGRKYSKSFSSPSGRWQQDFDAMAKKTVIKLLLSKWGILSIEMQTALKTDQAVLKDMDLDNDANIEYPDSGADTVDVEYKVHEDDVLDNIGEEKPPGSTGSVFDQAE